MTVQNNLKGAGFALMAFAIYSAHDVLVRWLGASFSPVQTLFFTSLLSFPVLTLMLVQDATKGNLRPLHPIWITIRSFAMVVAALCGFYAFSVLPMAQAYSILFMIPLLVTLMAIPILGERVGLHRAAAILVGLAGVFMVVRPGSAELSLGHMAAFGTAFGGALQSVISRRIGNEERPVVMMLFPLAAIFLTSGVGLGFVYEPMALRDLTGMAGVAVLGFIAAFCLVWAYRNGEAAFVAPMQYSQIIWAVVYGYLLFGEVIDRATLLGATLIIASGLYIVLREARGGGSANKPVSRSRTRTMAPGSFRVSNVLRRQRDKIIDDEDSGGLKEPRE